MTLTYNQALDLVSTVDSLAAGTLELEIDGVRLSVVKEPTSEVEIQPANGDEVP
jgi:hypothetical protein